MRRILVAIIAAALVVLAAVLIIRTNRFHSRQLAVEPIPPLLLDTTAAVERLAGALRFRTISNQDSTQFDAAEFRRFQDYLRTSFPRLHARLGREITGGFSLLYEWRGSDTTLKPILLMAHQDVVPVEPGTEGRWTEPPFAGRISGGFVWGRGAMDDKGNLMALLEAVERLVAGGAAPRRTIYLAFGHDEELGGTRGAARTAALLAGRHVQVEYVLDEGGAITTGLIAGVTAPVAVVGIAEKGYVSLELTAHATGGHSSMPPAHTAVGMLSAAVARSIPTAVCAGGMDECPPVACAVNSRLTYPFSAIPTTATGAVTPAISPVVIAPPSSSTYSTCTWRPASNAAVRAAPRVPPNSSSCPNAR